MLLDEPIHAPCISFENLARLWLKSCSLSLRHSAKSQRSKVLINLQRPRSQNLRKLPSRHPPQQIHLPQPVLCHGVSLRLGEVFRRGSPDVRYTPAVAIHHDWLLEAGKGNGSIKLRQRAVNEPPNHCPGKNNKEPKNPEEDSDEGSQ